MREQPLKKRGRKPDRRAARWSAAFAALALALLYQPGRARPAAVPLAPAPAAPQHKYVMLNVISSEQGDVQRMGADFLDAVNSEDHKLEVSLEPTPWQSLTQVCRNDQNCDRITIDTENRELLIKCPALPKLEKRPAGPCPPNLPRGQRRRICIETLPKDLAPELWQHSAVFHRGR